MIPSIHTRPTHALGLVVLVAVACCASPITHAQSRTRNATLNAGTVIVVHLDEALSSKEATKGDKFKATVKENDNSDTTNAWDLPAGTQIEGVVRLVRPKKDKQPGVLDLAFQRLILPDGRTYRMQGSLINLNNKYVTRDKNGRLTAKKGHRTDRLTFVGYGAGAGLLVGLLTDRKNVIRDTAIGAGLGYLYGALEKDRSKVNDVTLKEGTEMGVRLDSRLTYARAARNAGR
jgi:hypothetical protein